MKLIIAGGRDFVGKDLVEQRLKPYLLTTTEEVCGGALGADTEGELWARRNNIPVKFFRADWATHGNAAGPIRNKQMGDYADALVAFWDGKSRGTKGMINYMTKLGKPVEIIIYGPENSCKG